MLRRKALFEYAETNKWDDVFWFLTRGYVSKDATCTADAGTPLCNLLHGKDVLM
jgi:hypothetical protein